MDWLVVCMFVGSFVCVLVPNMTMWRVATLPQVASRNPATTNICVVCVSTRDFVMCFVACYGCFCRVCVVTYPYVHQACSLLLLAAPCNICCGGGRAGRGGTHVHSVHFICLSLFLSLSISLSLYLSRSLLFFAVGRPMNSSCSQVFEICPWLPFLSWGYRSPY